MDEEGSRTLVWKKPRLGVEEWVLSGKSPVSTLPTLSQTPFCPGKSPGIHIVPELQNKENSCLSLSNLTPESSLGPPGPRSVLLKFCLVRGLDSEGDLGPPPRVGSVTPGFLNRGETRVVTGRLSAGTKEPIFYSVCLDEIPALLTSSVVRVLSRSEQRARGWDDYCQRRMLSTGVVILLGPGTHVDFTS